MLDEITQTSINQNSDNATPNHHTTRPTHPPNDCHLFDNQTSVFAEKCV